MNFLEERIIQEGIIKSPTTLLVETFLNDQIDIALMDKIGQEFYHRFKDCPITKVLTIETSGIPVAYPVARAFGVPLVIARQARTAKMGSDVYEVELDPSIHPRKDTVVVSKKHLSAADRVLIIDDLLANGGTLQCLISLVETADATIDGLGVAIEKGFQEGGHRIRNLGYHLESLAIIDSLNPITGEILFRIQ